MRKIYLYAVALSLVFTACSSDDTFIEDPIGTKVTYMAKTPSSLTELITDISDDCKAINHPDMERRIAMVESEAFKYGEFHELIRQGYDTPTPEDWAYIVSTSKSKIINELNYSPLVKAYLYAMIIEQQSYPDSFFENLSLNENEKLLLETCRILNNKDDNEEHWKKTKPVAFAYGYQTSKANGVLMAVLVSLP